MRIGVIRGDLPGPIFVADLEPTSQVNVPTEPPGQTRYISRPTAVTVAPFIKTVPASVASTGNISFPLTLNFTNNNLDLSGTAAVPAVSATISAGTYANIDALVGAVNQSLATTGFVASALSPTKLAIRTTVTGEGTFLTYGSVASGSTFNTAAALAVGGFTHTVPSAGAFILGTLPVGGPLNVSVANVRSILGGGLSVAQAQAAADLIAPRFIESNTVLESYLVGEVGNLLSASFNPDPTRIPFIASGPAIAVVEDDGVTPFSYLATELTTAQLGTPGAGDVTLTGTTLAGVGTPNAEVEETKVAFYVPGRSKTVTQKAIVAAGGTVSATDIIIPASLVPAGTVAGTLVQVQYKSFVSNKLALV